MIVLAIHLHQTGLEVHADCGGDASQALECVPIEDPPAFGDEDQVDMESPFPEDRAAAFGALCALVPADTPMTGPASPARRPRGR